MKGTKEFKIVRINKGYMKTTISVFVSGSKKLKEHRLRLKALVNNLNGENRLKGSSVMINMFSYVNLGDNQADYDDFIQNKSDLVIFIIEDKIGEKTKQEFLLASKAQKSNGKPKTLIFMKEFQEKTPEIEEVERLISENTDSYYVDYSNLEDLEFKVKERLMQEVNQLIDETGGSLKKKNKVLKMWAWLTTLGLAAMLLFTAWKMLSDDNDVTLLFIGGGSAVNCLEEHIGIDNINHYENSICISVPTKTAWPIITSDVLHQHSIKNSRKTKLFYPICLSAMNAENADFLNITNKDQFISKGAVLAFHLGDDDLTLYVKTSYHNHFIDNKDTINIQDLAEFLREVSTQRFRIFTTEEGSGTLTYYQKSLAPYNMTLSKETLGEMIDRFTDVSPKSKIRRDETPYMMLGSRYYVAKEVYEEGDCRAICVVDENGNAITKSIYIYFAGYYVDEGTSFWIPDEAVNFLYRVNSDFRNIINNNRIPRENEQVIVFLNDCLK